MSDDNDDTPGIGDNRPPSDAEILRVKLAEEHAALIKRRDQLVAAADRAPAIESDNDARIITDFVKQLQALISASEKTRVGAKEPFLEGGRVVDGFFKSISDPVEKTKRTVEGNLTKYLRDKADRERREREEAERLAREEADRKRKEAEEAAAKIKSEKDLADALERDRLAKVAEADASKATKDAEAKPAEMSRTRGEYGGVSSLRTYWTFDSLDRDALDLEALRHHLPLDALAKAVGSFVRAGGREIKGARIFETNQAVVR